MDRASISNLSVKITVLLVICCLGLPVQAKYGGGTGEPNDPYLIYTAEQMNEIWPGNDWNKCFKLMADIDLSSYTGTEFNIIIIFGGVFDGNGHTISNFSYTSTDSGYIGLFGCVGGLDEQIKNLGLIDAKVDAGKGEDVGSLVGLLVNGTINNCYVEGGRVSGGSRVGGLVGWNESGTITNCGSSGEVTGFNAGGLVSFNKSGTITNCDSSSDVLGNLGAGGLVSDSLEGKIVNCFATGSVEGFWPVGGLVGGTWRGTIANCYATGNVSGFSFVGGLAGDGVNITNCYASGSVSGFSFVGGLAGDGVNITNCYASGSVSGLSYVGGLLGRGENITNCYSTGSVSGEDGIGGLVGPSEEGEVTASFWDIETSGQETSWGGIGKTTAEMQMQVTFTDAGWDFNTPIWTIDEGIDYPRLWWEFVPVLYVEPEVTLGTSNTISWNPVVSAVEYYAECAEDEDFTNIAYSSGWITETNYKFTGLELGKRYWYSVKARNTAGVETNWSNVESSLQCSLSGAVEALLNPESLKNKNMKTALLNKIEEALQMIDEGLYKEALNKLQNDIIQKTDGCAESGQPDKSDWIITCEQQSVIYPLIIETIEHVKGLME